MAQLVVTHVLAGGEGRAVDTYQEDKAVKLEVITRAQVAAFLPDVSFAYYFTRLTSKCQREARQ